VDVTFHLALASCTFATTALSSGSAQASAEKAALTWEETPANYDGQNTMGKKRKGEPENEPHNSDFFAFCLAKNIRGFG